MSFNIEIPDSRGDFVKSWLTESPEGIGFTDLSHTIDYVINDYVKDGSKIIDLGNNLKKIDGDRIVFYWYEINNEIILGAEFSKKPECLIVNAIGKKNKGHPPYASDLYNAVLADQNKSIRIMSDQQLSNEGLGIWKRLLNQGHKISVYDSAQPGKSFTDITSEDELMKYFNHDNSDFRKYQFVISESGNYWETKSYFLTRRYRELVGLL